MSDFTTTHCVALQTVGGSGGSTFNSFKEDGTLIYKIEAWADDNRMRGIKIYYSASDTGTLFGKEGGTKFSFTFNEGELIAKLSIWNTKWNDHTYVGAFKFTTSLGREFYPKEKTSSHKEYILNVGYGALIGVSGKGGNALDSLGFYLIKPADSLKMSDVVYATSTLSTPEIMDQTNITYNNNTSQAQSYEYDYSYTNSQNYAWETTSGFQDTYSISITASVPELGLDESASAEWTYSTETTTSSEFTSSQEVNDSYPVNVAPYTSVTLEMTNYVGKCNSSYTALVSLVLEGSSEVEPLNFNYHTKGTYAGANTTDVVVTVTETPVNSDGLVVGKTNTETTVVEQAEVN